MVRYRRRSEAASEIRLKPLRDLCEACGERSWVAYHVTRTVTTLEEPTRLRLVIRRCVNEESELYKESRRPEHAGAFSLPRDEFGLEVIAADRRGRIWRRTRRAGPPRGSRNGGAASTSPESLPRRWPLPQGGRAAVQGRHPRVALEGRARGSVELAKGPCRR